MVTKQVKIAGRVQGVWFRASTKKKAEELGVFGWIKNLSDGSVEGMFQGSEEKVTALINWCHQGPSAAQVQQVTVMPAQTSSTFSSFEIR